MKTAKFIAAIVVTFVVGYYIGCSDEMLPAAETQRYVYEVSEANVTGAGGYVDVPVLHVGAAGQGGRSMPLVLVYGSGRGGNDVWQMLVNVEVSEEKVKVDPQEYPSYYYRVVVLL